jgi:SpoVK/Ycf46/Vps4 family AAA+-type ATPase
MSALAQRVPTPFAREALVVSARTNVELDLGRAWVRLGHWVLETRGLGRRMSVVRALTAVFAGPPGTGKTMAAQILAAELDVELYRVDLSHAARYTAVGSSVIVRPSEGVARSSAVDDG